MSDQTLDLPEFLERVQDDKELLLELFDIFVEDFQVKRPMIEESINQKNFEELRSLAHSLKGASGNISAKDLRQTMMTLEDKGKNENLDGAKEVLQTLDAQFQALQVRIEEVKKEFSQ